MSVLNKQLSMPSLPSLRVRMPSRPARRTATVTGLEIGATKAIAAQARLQGGQIVAERVAGRDLPPGLMRDGLVTDPDSLASELKSLFSEHKFSKRVRVGLATPRTILRVIDLPPLEDKDIRTALVMQAQERIPMPLDRAVMDFHKVGLVDTSEGQRLRVIVVVTEREGVDLLLDTLRRAGLKPEGIDLSVFSVIRSLNHHVDSPEAPVLFAQLGDLVNIAIAEAGVCRFTRQAPQGLAMVLGRLAENRGISFEQAHALLHNSDADDLGSDGDLSVPDLLKRAALELGSELRAAAEFYSTQFGSEPVITGVVAGPLAPLPGFVEALSAASGLELTCGEVIAGTPDALGDVDARIAAVATGLAVGALTS
ncbi:MAG TPA: pilus assembly protein PilM [Solirubrobacteraceae bacterium]|nr:pilus assembly protein PilM [Solirubrobacteraceae bacterium]